MCFINAGIYSFQEKKNQNSLLLSFFPEIETGYVCRIASHVKLVRYPNASLSV